MSSTNSNVNIFEITFWFLYANYYWVTPILLMIISFIVKHKIIKIGAVLFHFVFGLYWILTAENYRGGGGYGDLAAALLGIIIIFLALIQGIIVYVQIKRRAESQRMKN